MALMIVFLAFSLFLQGSLGEIICEELPTEICSFSIASSGKRCLLETNVGKDGGGVVEYECKTSEVVVDALLAEWIENDECTSACGVDRNSVGISSDSLLDPLFTSKLCAPDCYFNCFNILDLYFNLALAEGMFLPDLCEAQRANPRRAMTELLSSSAAPGPVSVAALAPAPTSTESSAIHAAAPAPIYI